MAAPDRNNRPPAKGVNPDGVATPLSIEHATGYLKIDPESTNDSIADQWRIKIDKNTNSTTFAVNQDGDAQTLLAKTDSDNRLWVNNLYDPLQPSYLRGVQLWLDANDRSTITTEEITEGFYSGRERVLTWTDKISSHVFETGESEYGTSPIILNYTDTSTGVEDYIFSKGCLYFTFDSLLFNASQIISSSQGTVFFAISRFSFDLFTYWDFFIGEASFTTDDSFGLYVKTSNAPGSNVYTDTGTVNDLDSEFALKATDDMLLSPVGNGLFPTFGYVYSNGSKTFGSLQGISSTPFSQPADSGAWFSAIPDVDITSIGCIIDSQGVGSGFYGNICEIVVTTEVPTETEIAAMNNYFHYKWGIPYAT